MKNQILILSIFFLVIIGAWRFIYYGDKTSQDPETLRRLYSQPDASKWPAPTLDSLVDLTTFEDIGILPDVVYPDYNLYSQEKSVLGKALFFDPRLSISGQIACASCHNPELGWTDNLTRSFGHDRQTGKRNSMTILNVGYAKELFWDGRAKSLEEQVEFPIMDQLEMNQSTSLAVDEIAAIRGYRDLFYNAFGDDSVNIERIKYAVATFERTIKSPPSKFDRFVSGTSDLFSDQEIQGMHLFINLKLVASTVTTHLTLATINSTMTVKRFLVLSMKILVDITLQKILKTWVSLERQRSEKLPKPSHGCIMGISQH